MDRQFAYDQRQERIADQRRHDDVMWRHMPAVALPPASVYRVLLLLRPEGTAEFFVQTSEGPADALRVAEDRMWDEDWKARRALRHARWATVNDASGEEVLVAAEEQPGWSLRVVSVKGGKQWGQRINTQEAAA